MNFKKINKDKYNTLDIISLIVMVTMVFYAFYKNYYVGIFSVLVFIFLIGVDFYKKNKESAELEHRIKRIEFNLDVLMKKSLINMPVPVSFLDFDGSITWSNKLFDSMVGMEEDGSIGKNIEDLIGEINIRKVLDESKIMEAEFDFSGRSYNIKYFITKINGDDGEEVDYRIVLFWFDKTEYDKIRLELEENRAVIVNIEVDGFDDVLKSAPEDNRPNITRDIEKLLSNLEAETEGLLNRISKSKYILFIKKSSFDLLEKNKFSVLDRAREIDYGNTLPVTLSMGIGYDANTLEENGEFASGAMDMALGRGGDQVVIKNKERFEFYGGKSKVFERKTKVRSRLIGLALKEVINQSEKILIMGHHYPDMDAMGAAVGVYDICKSFGKDANIVLDEVNEAIEIFANRLKEDSYYDGIFVSHEKALDICKKDTLVVVVDTHRPSYTEFSRLLEISKKVVVIDHHRRGVEYINETVLLFHEIYVSSTCEMVTELIQYTDHDIKINKLTAEGLLGGIYLDTKNFEFKTGVRTFEAASYLRSVGADTLSVKKFFNSYAEDFLIKAEIIQRTEILDEKICISYSKEEIDNINIVIAKAADELLNIKKIEASFVLGMNGDTVFVSARSLGDINVHVLMEKLGGGGHIDIAGAQIKDMSLSQAYNMVKDIILEYLEEEKS